jgi:hypothetical protein
MSYHAKVGALLKHQGAKGSLKAYRGATRTVMQTRRYVQLQTGRTATHAHVVSHLRQAGAKGTLKAYSAARKVRLGLHRYARSQGVGRHRRDSHGRFA